MRPTEVLMQEHRVIEQVLNVVERIAADCERAGKVDAGSARQAIDFLRTFADRCHHGKEEEQLFPMMEVHGFSPEQGPTAVMRQDHVEGRGRIQAMDQAIEGASTGDADACGAYVPHARAYVLLLREHIQKEDHCLFPMADQALSEDDQRELQARFRRVEHDEIGPQVHADYLKLADDLARRWEVEPAAVASNPTGCGCGHTH